MEGWHKFSLLIIVVAIMIAVGMLAKASVISSVTNSKALSGSGTFSSLLYNKSEMATKRSEANRGLYEQFGGPFPLSTEWWIDRMCSAKIPKTGNGMAFNKLWGMDEIVMVGYVAGERIPYTALSDTGTDGVNESQMYIYKLAVKIVNNDNMNKTLTFNVFLDDTVKLFNRTIRLADGMTFGRVDGNIIVKTSSNIYDKICIKFISRPLMSRSGTSYNEIGELCNRIVESSNSPSTYTVPSYSGPSGSSSGSGSYGSSDSSLGGVNNVQDDGTSQVANEI